MLSIVVGEATVRFVQVLVFLALAPTLTLRWREHSSGIALGFGLYSAVMLFATARFLRLGTRSEFLWFITSVVSYSVALSIWIWVFSVPTKEEIPSAEPSPSSPSPSREQHTHLLEVS
jgi:hypothetical protein